jgi:hypothetical protein
MPTTLIDEIEGIPLNKGCSMEKGFTVFEKLAKERKQNSSTESKRIILIQNWQWLDIDLSDYSAEQISDDFNPNMIYAPRITRYTDSDLRPRYFVRSSPLVEFHDDCIFETKNSFYIMGGPGTKKTVTPRIILSIEGY